MTLTDTTTETDTDTAADTTTETETAADTAADTTTETDTAIQTSAEDRTVTESTQIIYATMDSPVGEIVFSGVRSATAPGGVALASLRMGAWKQSKRRDRDARVGPGWVLAQEEFEYVIRTMQEYFRGERTEFDFGYTVRGTPFQERVWEELKKIPYGTTTTYGRITADLGLDRVQARAVGGAVGNNPLGIVVPCHRVIGANGALTGYAGGLENKEALLVLEGVLPQPLV